MKKTIIICTLIGLPFLALAQGNGNGNVRADRLPRRQATMLATVSATNVVATDFERSEIKSNVVAVIYASDAPTVISMRAVNTNIYVSIQMQLPLSDAAKFGFMTNYIDTGTNKLSGFVLRRRDGVNSIDPYIK